MKIVHRCVSSLYNGTNIESDVIVARLKTLSLNQTNKATQTTSLTIALLPVMCTMHDLGP